MSLQKEKAILESNTIASCIKLSKEIVNPVGNVKNVAILSNFNTKGLAECLKVKSFIYDIFLNIYEGQYSQWRQEILGRGLYEFKPNIIFLFIDQYGLDEEIFYRYFLGGEELNEPEKKANELFQFINHLKTKTKAKIIIGNSPKLWPPLMGIFDNKLINGWYKIIDRYNSSLSEACLNDKQVFIFNFDEWLGHIGKKEGWYDKYFFMADMRLSPNAIPSLAEELVSYLVPLAGKRKKCIVLDLDNTLWGGVVGEDGLAGIKLAPNGQGQQFYYFQKLLLGFSKRGILLAINSKNNEEDVKEVFLKHPHMVLKESDFAAAKINWDNKAQNMKEISEELNIGLDSFVFIDDDPANRELIKSVLPEVDVLDLPSDSTQYIRCLLDYKGFNTFEFTEEDRERKEMYQQDKQRREFKEAVIDMDAFLKNLSLKISIKQVDEFSVARCAQLTQKTNQFNLTTFRYQEEDIKKFMAGGAKLWTLNAVDKFGEYGLTGLCIVKDMSGYWEIDTMLLSCRVLGKKIEEQFFHFILNDLKEADAKLVRGFYKPTAKNSQVKDFYGLFNFKKIDSADNGDVWERELGDYEYVPYEFIEIIH